MGAEGVFLFLLLESCFLDSFGSLLATQPILSDRSSYYGFKQLNRSNACEDIE